MTLCLHVDVSHSFHGRDAHSLRAGGSHAMMPHSFTLMSLTGTHMSTGRWCRAFVPTHRSVQDFLGPSMKAKAMKAVKVAPKWLGTPQPFGSAYTCALTDTVTEVCRSTAPRSLHACPLLDTSLCSKMSADVWQTAPEQCLEFEPCTAPEKVGLSGFLVLCQY